MPEKSSEKEEEIFFCDDDTAVKVFSLALV
jgi:hypothetical protein